MELITKNGYPLMEVVSALQKEIRRGNEVNAHYWALEFMPKFERYLWRRLFVIVNEDIGLASPETIILVKTLRDQFFEMREGGDGAARLVLANAILAMCRAPKSRLSDYFNCVVEQEKNQGVMHLQIPDYAVDKHTARGRQMGRSFDHWHDEGCKLHPVEPPTPLTIDQANYEERALEIWKETNRKMVNEEWPKTGKKDTDQQLTLL
jgi:replication-associated recombination protein RarA